ncbi:MAG: ROK family transcriptional regulator [Eubacteriales bacterium]|nr:ROK family transcriptional regulator [Eubacteriales bacterium]
MTNDTASRKGNNIKLVKEANKYLILQCILKFAPLSTEEIVSRTGLSRPTVLGVMRELADDQLIARVGYSESSGGRAAGLWGMDGEGHFAVGVDFEFPQVRMVIANLKNEIRCAKTLTYPRTIEKTELLERFFQELGDFIDLSGVPREAIDGVGLGLPGVIDTVNGVSMNIERIRGWHDVHIQRDLERHLRLPVYIKNDVHLMGLTEKRLFLGDEASDFIYIGFRSGIGSVTYQQGRPMKGEKGNAGFIGHTTLNPAGPACCCGSRGCLDVYASKLSISAKYMERRRAQGNPPAETPGFIDLVTLARGGDESAAEVLRDAGFYLGVAVANMIKTVEIPRVVIGGSPALKQSVFLEAMEASMKQYLTDSLGVCVSLACGQLPEEKYALGGCLLVFDHLFSKPKLSLSLV